MWSIGGRSLSTRAISTVRKIKAFIAEAARHAKHVALNVGAPRYEVDEAEALKWYAAVFDLIRAHYEVGAFSLMPSMHLVRQPKVAAYLKQQLAYPRFIDRPKRRRCPVRLTTSSEHR